MFYERLDLCVHFIPILAGVLEGDGISRLKCVLCHGAEEFVVYAKAVRKQRPTAPHSCSASKAMQVLQSSMVSYLGALQLRSTGWQNSTASIAVHVDEQYSIVATAFLPSSGLFQRKQDRRHIVLLLLCSSFLILPVDVNQHPRFQMWTLIRLLYRAIDGGKVLLRNEILPMSTARYDGLRFLLVLLLLLLNLFRGQWFALLLGRRILGWIVANRSQGALLLHGSKRVIFAGADSARRRVLATVWSEDGSDA